MHDAVVSLALRFPRFSLCVFDSCETSWFIDIMGQENAHFSHHLSAVNRKLHRLHRLCVWLSLHRKSSQFQWTAHKSRHFHRSREMQATQKSFMLETQLGCECIISVKRRQASVVRMRKIEAPWIREGDFSIIFHFFLIGSQWFAVI